MRTHIRTPNPSLLAFNAALAAMPIDKRQALGKACEIPEGRQLGETLHRWWLEMRTSTETPAAYIEWLMSPDTDPVMLSKKKAFACHV